MTISYNRLGSNGRLGNQMFQYAGLRGIAANRGFDWLIPPPNSYGDSNYGLFDCFKMETVEEKNFGQLNAQSIATGVFHFDENFFNQCPDNVNLHDYFTTEKYFANVKDIIRKDFQFKDEILEPCKEVVDELDNPIFMHLRRGDYSVNPDAHPMCPITYYEKALELYDKDSPVLVFSDDIEWCKEQEFFAPDRFMFSESTETHEDGALVPFVDLCLMTLCNGGITANSSLSWWGGFLQKDRTRKLISPQMWFGPAYDKHDTKDLVNPDRDWIRL